MAKPFSQVIDAVREKARQFPERMADCQYFDDAGFPCCIFGHVLADLGVRRPGEEDFGLTVGETRVALEGNSCKTIAWNLLGFRAPGDRQEDWISLVQDSQDAGMPWEEAINAADKALRSHS